MHSIERLFHSSVARGVALLLVGVALGYGLGDYVGAQSGAALVNSLKSSLVPIQEDVGGASLVHPLLAYRTPEATILGQYQGLKDSLQGAVDAAQKSGGASRVSIYFRDLNSARWVGINQEQTYYPASLLKVPVMIAYYKQAEITPSLLAESVVYQDIALPDPFDATSTLVVGQTYSVESLIEHMIKDSDNGATFTLLDRLNPDLLTSVYTSLGIDDPGDESATYQIANRTYALFFRILYNATYLSTAYSQKALELLSQATFVDGLAAGVPAGTTVAHKFGEHVLTDKGKVSGIELSDCGVTYYPDHPYLLCVMTSAKDVTSASTIIKNISQITYAAIAQQYAATTTAGK